MGAVAMIQVLLIQYGGAVFGTVPLSFETWLRIFVLSSMVLVVGQLLRFSELSRSAVLHDESKK
jgi:Ca2+-transporting ATPase